MYGSTHAKDSQLAVSDPNSSKESSVNKRSLTLSPRQHGSRSKSPNSSSTSLSPSPAESVEQPLLALSDISGNQRKARKMSDYRQMEESGASWASASTGSSYMPPGDVNSSYHGFVGDGDTTFSIVSEVRYQFSFFIWFSTRINY